MWSKEAVEQQFEWDRLYQAGKRQLAEFLAGGEKHDVFTDPMTGVLFASVFLTDAETVGDTLSFEAVVDKVAAEHHMGIECDDDCYYVTVDE